MELAFIDELAGEIKINYDLAWIKNLYDKTGKEFGDSYGDYTGKLLYHLDNDLRQSRKYTINYQMWELTLHKVTDKITGEYYTKLKIKGNPSKMYYGGRNYRSIPLNAFRAILGDFADTFNLDLNKIILTAQTETSVTVPLNDLKLLDTSFLGKFVIYNYQEVFKAFHNNENDLMGYFADSSHVYQKAYFPAVKFGEPLNSLRLENKYKKIQSLTKSKVVTTWGDLFTDKGQFFCYKDVLSMWDGTMIIDPVLRKSKSYPTYLNEIIEHAGDPVFWRKHFPDTATAKTLKKRIREYRELSYKKGAGLHTRVRNWIRNEGEKFQDVTTWLTGNNRELYNSENKEESMELLINKDIDTRHKEHTIFPLLINSAGILKEKRLCRSCGKDISSNKAGSSFCSSKFVGSKAAKKCRNQISNLTWNKRRKKVNTIKVEIFITSDIENDSRKRAQQIIARARARMYADPYVCDD